jgi:hydroxymethylpyrimidine/phosphomethylpyrimidine kinase
VIEAVAAAKRFITEAIRHGLALGQGHGPTNPYAAVRQEWKS